VLTGKYGPYVTDGSLNASLPRDADPQALTMAEALDLLARRAERVGTGGARRGGRFGKGAGKTSGKKPGGKARAKKPPADRRRGPP
jgi:DNA topoisomerase-1